MSEFEFERGEILTNLTLLEDHADKFQCPYCMEKHASKIIGYAEEIAMGGEDVEQMKRLAEDARKWRRQIQGAKEHSHHSHNPIRGRTCAKLEKCVRQVKAKQKCPKSEWGTREDCVNPYAVCRASVKCA